MRSATIRTLVVKGNKFTAARAAADRGIPAAFLSETETGLTILATRVSVETLNAWFCEATDMRPFPAGTLLLWSEHHNTTLAKLRRVK